MTHRTRMNEMLRADVKDTAQALALGVISMCLEDYEAQRECDLDVEFWAEFGSVPVAWIDELLR